jgi:hypothetical protein
MRVRHLLIPVLLAVIACGCGEDDDYADNESEIVFGIGQRTVKTSEGEKKETTAGYEYLRLANKGGWGPWVFRDGDGEGTCYFERFEDRLGKPRVESGVATFRGGKLPSPAGLQILANQPDAKLDGPGWADGDILTFDVSGFAMPPITTTMMYAPSGTLDIKAITPAPAEASGTELSLKSTDSVGVTWTPVTTGPRSRVMVSLETEEESGRGSQVRCFGSPESGSAVIPSDWVARLFSTVPTSAPIKGHLEIASHRQVTIYARGSWIGYVVATNVQREQAFTGVR